MTLAATAALIADASAREGAVASFNVITLEHAEGIVLGAERAGAGILLQLSENAVRYHGSPRAILAACRALAETASVRVGIHFDHIETPELAAEVIELGPSAGVGSIMFDASTRPFEQNVELTREIATTARSAGLWVEAELGRVGGKDGAHVPGVRTDPLEATDFVRATGVDGLAVAVGSSHAMTEKTASLDTDLIARLRAVVPVPLVLHGSSGVADDTIAAAVAAGIRKVNVGTALNVGYTGAIRGYLQHDQRVTDPRRFLVGARDAIADEVARLCSVVVSG